MSNASYYLQWQEAMGDLQEQVHLEDETLEMNLDQRAKFQTENSEGKSSGPPVDQMDAFQHYACLYIKYLQIFKQLDAAFDNLVHPQKRIDLRLVLDSIMARVVELNIQTSVSACLLSLILVAGSYSWYWTSFSFLPLVDHQTVPTRAPPPHDRAPALRSRRTACTPPQADTSGRNTLRSGDETL